MAEQSETEKEEEHVVETAIPVEEVETEVSSEVEPDTQAVTTTVPATTTTTPTTTTTTTTTAPSSATSTGGKKGESSITFPKAFYCPITKNLFTDPVIIPDGTTFERRAILERGDLPPDTALYVNRALKTILEGTVELKTSTALKRLKNSVRQLSQQLMSPEYRPLSGGYCCPITLSLMHVPVVDPEGYSFEQAAIHSWIRANGVSPVTRQPLSLEQLYPNHALTALMEEEKCKPDDLLHPSFKQWKEETPPVATVDPSASMEEGLGGATGITTTNIIRFPTTPGELQEATRLRRIRWYQRMYFYAIMVVLIAVGIWLAPILATVLLVLVLSGVAWMAGSSSNSSDQTF